MMASSTVGDGLPEAGAREAVAFDRRFRACILPFWADQGVDPRSALFWERFDFEGRPMRDVPHRLMVQARQVATFAQAESRGVGRAGAVALRAFDHAIALCADEGDLSHGVAFSMRERVVDATRDAYTHAFVLFGLAAALRLSGERRYRSAIDDLLGFVDTRLVDPLFGGLHSHWPNRVPGKAQNPTMHLLEAYLALHEAWPERDFLARAKGLVNLAEQRLASNPAGAVLEHYTTDWHPCPETPDGSFFEPGHQFEWAWLVARYARLAGDRSRTLVDRLWQTGMNAGFDTGGFCIDAVSLDHAPLTRTRRLWPQCEAARAALIRRGDVGDAVAATALNRLNTQFVGRPFAAGWIDRLDENGAPLIDFVPASSLYHLYGVWSQMAEAAPSEPQGRLVKDPG